VTALRKSLRCSSDLVWRTTPGAIAFGELCWLDAVVGVTAAAGDAGVGAEVAVTAGIAETVTGAGAAAVAVVADAAILLSAGTPCSSSGGSSSSTHVLPAVQILLPAQGLMHTVQAR